MLTKYSMVEHLTQISRLEMTIEVTIRPSGEGHGNSIPAPFVRDHRSFDLTN